MGEVTPALRLAVVKTFMEGKWTLPEIAATMDVSPQTVSDIVSAYLEEQRSGCVVLRGVPSRINEQLARDQYTGESE